MAEEPRTLDILFLEDDASIRNVMRLTLERLGHRVLCSGSVKEAIALLKTFMVDMVICDLTLPDGSGLEVIHHIPPGAPVHKIILSGHGDIADIARSKAAGFDLHLVKPVDMGILQRAVWQLTGKPL